MGHEVAIRVESVSKKYCASLKRSMSYGILDIAKNTLGMSSQSDKLRKGEFWAVDDVSFDVKKGEALGIIGLNGSGKTTLLKMFNGIYWPDKGRITIKGRVGALIEVGAGFHPMLTGRENVYINGSILGMSRIEIDRKFDDIVNFADIGDFLDSPVKHYSSGMYVRLGFAIAIHSEPDILLVDEVLAVGDFNFQRKCIEKIEEMRTSGLTIIFVSHNLHMTDGLCERAVYLNKGKRSYFGRTNEAITMYQRDANLSIKEDDVSKPGFRTPDFSTGEVDIKAVDILDEKGQDSNSFSSEDKMLVRVHYFAKKKIQKPVFSFGIYRDDGICCCGDRSLYHNITVEQIEGNGIFEIKINKLQLTAGAYIFGVVIFDSNVAIPYAYRRMGKFVVASKFPTMGTGSPVFIPDFEWRRFK
jgi:lipopolysaccharide transport system ATP-binding protein